MKTINSMDELIESNLKVIVANHSNIWWEYKNHFEWKTILDNNLKKLFQLKRLIFMNDEHIDKVSSKYFI